ncbi:MAG: histidine triad family protein [Frankiales bacterium]|nr:histidine triad family protein [Frankiales bacterium]
MSDECLFCRIVRGEIPADVVHEGELTLAFRDINPAAPTHVLVITKQHYTDVAAVAVADPELAAQLLTVAADVAESEGVARSGWRLSFNVGADSGQLVPHVHAHVMGGRALGHPAG